MTRRTSPILLFVLAALLVVVNGCGPEEDGRSSETGASLALADSSVHAVRGVVEAFIHEQTAEGSPYFIQSKATQFDRLLETIVENEGARICSALFRGDGSTFLVEYVLKRELESFVITRVILKSVDSEPVDRLLYDRASLLL